MTRSIGCMMLLALLSAAPTQADPILTLLPGAGSAEALPGETVGWGYEITNDDPDDWLLIASLNTDLFQYGTLTDIFDYPILAPGTTVTIPYQPGLQGLAEFTWSASAPVGFTNSGLFTIGAELWSGNPFVDGTFVSAIPDLTVPYSISTTDSKGTAVPEPASLTLLSTGLAALVVCKRRRRSGRATRESRNEGRRG